MGADLFAFPHGIHVDQEGNVWVTDPLPPDGRGAGGDVGQQVTKLSPTGEILLQLGTRKVAGDGPNQFSSPSDVVVGRNGDIFVADGHGEGTTERIMKFDKDGKFIKSWGKSGNGACGAGEFSSLHAIAIDSRGRLFIGDRDNNRIQIYDQDGNYLDCWYQFSRPSGIFIDADDNLFVADSESRDGANEGRDLAHPGGNAASGSAARATARSGISFRIPTRKAAAAPPRASPRSTAAPSSTAPRSARGRSCATTGGQRTLDDRAISVHCRRSQRGSSPETGRDVREVPPSAIARQSVVRGRMTGWLPVARKDCVCTHPARRRPTDH